jgi:hypothetical protein
LFVDVGAFPASTGSVCRRSLCGFRKQRSTRLANALADPMTPASGRLVIGNVGGSLPACLPGVS